MSKLNATFYTNATSYKLNANVLIMPMPMLIMFNLMHLATLRRNALLQSNKYCCKYCCRIIDVPFHIISYRLVFINATSISKTVSRLRPQLIL